MIVISEVKIVVLVFILVDIILNYGILSRMTFGIGLYTFAEEFAD